MQIARRYKVLVFVDAVGISTGYRMLWESLLQRNGLSGKVAHVVTRSTYSNFSKGFLLEWRKSRKQPGFNTKPANQLKIRTWVKTVIQQHEPDLVVCSDPALLFMLNSDWNQATLDRLRGGLYMSMGLPWVVTLPITALHSKMKQSDIAKLNEGFVEKADYEEFRSSEDGDEPEDDEETMEWHEPIIVPYGKVVLDFDYQKVARILGRIEK